MKKLLFSIAVLATLGMVYAGVDGKGKGKCKKTCSKSKSCCTKAKSDSTSQGGNTQGK